MKRNKLFHIFYTLSPKEIKDLKIFVCGHKPATIATVVDFLAANRAKFEPENFEELRIKASKKLSLQGPKNDQKLRRLFADTMQLLNDFLMFREVKTNRPIAQQLLQEQYKYRLLHPYYETSIKESINELTANIVRDFNYHQKMFRLRKETYFYLNPTKITEINAIRELEGIHHHLDLDYLLTKLHYIVQVKIAQLVQEQETTKGTLDLVLPNTDRFANNVLVLFYLEFVALIDHPQEAGFLKLKSTWLEIENKFSTDVRYQLFYQLINMAWFSCVGAKRTTEIFKILVHGFEEEILVNAGYLETNMFNNFVDIGCSLKEFKKVTAFIEKCIPYLRAGRDKKENITRLYEAFLLFGEGQFDEALLKTNFVEFSDPSYGLRAYPLVIKCLYETKKSKGFEEIETRCNAYKQYLHRKHKQGFINKLSREENLNFMKIVRQLPNASSSKYARISPDMLLEQTKTMQRLINRAWLLEKINALP